MDFKRLNALFDAACAADGVPAAYVPRDKALQAIRFLLRLEQAQQPKAAAPEPIVEFKHDDQALNRLLGEFVERNGRAFSDPLMQDLMKSYAMHMLRKHAGFQVLEIRTAPASMVDLLAAILAMPDTDEVGEMPPGTLRQ